MKAYERFLKYVSVLTPSDENSGTAPSSKCQFNLAHILVDELKALGVSDAYCDEYCYVYGHIPATPGYENVTPIGFIAHMDTVADFCDHDCNPIITENYDGCDLELGTSGRVLSTELFPHLKEFAGRTLITSDGTTILGADDKAGIAEIITVVENLGSYNHGPISVAFTPDEEIGVGAAHFDVAAFGARYAYTMDGDLEGGIEYETFNANAAEVKFTGENVHPGSAKDVMINAALVAMEFNAMLPAAERPEHTEGYEGFYHLTSMEGSVGEATLKYILRDHDGGILENRNRTMELAAKFINEKYGAGTCELMIRQQYRNMAEVINACPETIENAKAACERAGIDYHIKAVRGGTDGSQLSFMGLPCPNLGTGGYAFHGPYEHITIEGMDIAVKVIEELIKVFAEK